MDKSPAQPNIDKTCPYLGIFSDPHTAMGYPSVENHCFLVSPPVSPRAIHQQYYCLVRSHTQCERYATKSDSGTSAALIADTIKPKSSIGQIVRISIFGLITIGIVGLLAWLFSVQPWNPPPPTQSPQPSTTGLPVVMKMTTPHPTLSPMSTVSAIPTATLAASPTHTHAPVAPHYLETFFGTTHQFFLHRVIEGESLNSLSEIHGTTPEAIRAINVGLDGILFADTVIIIPVNQTDVTYIPKMVTIEIVEADTSLRALAELYEVDLSVLMSLNDLPEDYRFQIGEWVVIPEK